MKRKKNRILGSIVVLLVIGVNTISLSKYNSNLEAEKNLRIAKPIINVVKSKEMNNEIFENSPQLEYDFLINNYNENEINEVELDYMIEIIASVDNFPIEYELYDMKTNKPVVLTEGKSEKFMLKSKEKEDRRFKIIINWRELTEELAEKVEIELKVDAVQSKGG